jgi:putative transposase
MPNDSLRQHRRSIRLAGYDYSQAGIYYVTICTQGRLCLFGEIAGDEMRLSEAGRMVEYWWCELPNRYMTVNLAEFVVMPNHLHGIIVISESNTSSEPVGADRRVCPRLDASVSGEDRIETNAGGHIGPPLPAIIQWYKTMTTNEYIKGVKTKGWPRFEGRLWQRNYYEHIIRNEESLNHTREYIMNNVAQWESDRENPHTSW